MPRTTLTLEEDALKLAKAHATRHRLTLGKAVSELVRRAVDRHIVTADKSGLRVLQLNIPTALPWPTHEHDEAAHRGFSAGRRGR